MPIDANELVPSIYALLTSLNFPTGLPTLAEATAGVTPVNFAYPAGTVDRYGFNLIPGTTDMTTAVQNAAKLGGVVTFLGATYLFSGVSLSQSVVFQGQGMSTILLAKAAGPGNAYSSNLFTDAASLSYVTFYNLVLNGACTAAANQSNAWNIALIQLTQTATIRFENVTVTGYAASAFGASGAVTTQFFQALTLYNATQVDLINVVSTQNYFPAIQIYFTPTSDGVCNIQRCKQIFPSGGTAFQTFLDVIGGAVSVTDCYMLNGGRPTQGFANSWMNFEVPQSVNVKGCRFITDDGGSVNNGVCINVGQSTFPYNNNVTIEQNYFQAVGEPISVGPGQNVVIRDNLIKHCQLQGIQVQANSSTSFATYNALLPAYPAGAFVISQNLTISGNKIIGVATASAGYAIGVLDDVVNGAFGWQNVNINDNEILCDTANSFMLSYAIRLRDVGNINIERNTLNYGSIGVYNDGTTNGFNFKENTLIPINYLSGVAQTQDDILFGAFPPTNVVIERNNFTLYPPLPVRYNVNFAGGNPVGCSILDNQGMKQSFPVSAAATSYVIRNTKQQRVTAAPSTGNWGIGDVVFSVPATSAPIEYDCTTAGSFAVISGVTVTYVNGNTFCTQTGGTTLAAGMRISIVNGAGGGSPLIACVLFVSGTTVFLDNTFGITEVTGQACTIVNPTFHAAANFA